MEGLNESILPLRLPKYAVGHRYTYEQTLMVRGADHHFVECTHIEDTESMFLLVLGPAELAHDQPA